MRAVIACSRSTRRSWRGRIHDYCRRGGDGRAGHDDLPDHVRMRGADVIIGAWLVDRDARGLAALKQAGVPAAGVGARGVMHRAAAVGEGDLAAGLDGYTGRGDVVV